MADTTTVLSVRVQPKAAGDAVEGFVADADGNRVLKLRVTAVPDKGKANKAVIALLARTLGLPKSAITIASGDKSRNKTVRIDADATVVHQRLETLS